MRKWGIGFGVIGLATLGLIASLRFTGTAAGATTDGAGNALNIATGPTTAVVSFNGMAPGDVVTRPITVSNDGSLELRYAVTSITSEDTLAAQLDLTVKTGVTTCTNAGFGADGTALYGPADLGSTLGINVAGDPAHGAQVGDQTLAPGSSDVLCLQVSLPLSTGNGYQGLTSTATLEFAAKQTVSN